MFEKEWLPENLFSPSLKKIEEKKLETMFKATGTTKAG